MQNNKEILEFLHLAEKLKTIKRALCVSDNSRQESPAEHSWRVALIAVILHENLNLKLDLLKSLKIILVHDLVEVLADDVFILKPSEKVLDEKNKKESQAAEKIYSSLPEPLGNELKNLWFEYNKRSSAEAKFAYALDKIEVITQRAEIGIKNWERSDIYELVLHWADDSVEDFPELKPLWLSVQKELKEQASNQRIS